ncbi:hypothetical protein LSH36_121g09037 [Paralvinella palmiformis]|uniref:Uncharacterized protein n=1 Tax=Paralvinella palmiformis TaxID=53620 RepID=A0AAD9JXD6_9ANNE|nr:hypothetical protein LSH36_121g09037 [Paralvinella palmiformis]
MYILVVESVSASSNLETQAFCSDTTSRDVSAMFFSQSDPVKCQGQGHMTVGGAIAVQGVGVVGGTATGVCRILQDDIPGIVTAFRQDTTETVIGVCRRGMTDLGPEVFRHEGVHVVTSKALKTVWAGSLIGKVNTIHIK